MTSIDAVTELQGATVLVTGAGVSGPGAVRLVLRLGGSVVVADDRPAARTALRDTVLAAEGAGAAARIVDIDTAAATEHLDRVDLVVTSPGWRPDSPLLRAAAEAGLPVWGDVELCWRADQEGCFGAPRTWVAVTGTNGKTTTTAMLADMLRAGGLRAAACGNIGIPVPEVLLGSERIDFLAAELSSFQLHWAPSCRPHLGLVLNIAEDHLDWHGSLAAYTAAKAQVLNGRVAVVGADDVRAAALLPAAAAARKISVTLAAPAADQLGVVDGRLVDAAFSAPAADFFDATAVRPPGPAGITDALAAAALARAAGVGCADIAGALAGFTVGAHRAAEVATIDGIRYVDDSKATNPHAARTSLLAGGKQVWLAGGLLKGAHVDELVAEVAPVLRAAVLFGRDRAAIAEALTRHAPQVPVLDLASGDDTGTRDARAALPDPQPVMDAAVRAATEFAEPGDTVLLAPAAASMDMFRDYGHRGDSFAAAVAALQTEEDQDR